MNLNKQLQTQLEKLAQSCINENKNKETIVENAEVLLKAMENMSTEEKALFMVVYSGLKWDQGYEQGKNDPDFENSDIEA